MYFSKFPLIIYDMLSNDNRIFPQVLTDITLNVRLRKTIFDKITLFDEYDIKEGETPEIIAEKMYGNPELHWIVMLANERYDYVKDFPLTSNELLEFVKDKYGYDKIDGIHHYEDVRGLTAEMVGILSIPISVEGLKKYDIINIIDNINMETDTYDIIGTGKIDTILEIVPIQPTTNFSLFDSWPKRPITVDLYNTSTKIGTADVISYGLSYMNLTNMVFLGTHTKDETSTIKLIDPDNSQNIFSVNIDSSVQVTYRNLLIYLDSGHLTSGSTYIIKSLTDTESGPKYLEVYRQTDNVDEPIYCILDPNYTAITNFEYEFKENEKKRRIRLINKSIIPEIIREFNALL